VAVTVRTFVTDLCPIKPTFVDLGDTKVKIQYGVDTKKPPAEITMTRLRDKAVQPVAKKYEEVVQETVNAVDRKIKDLLAAKDQKGAEAQILELRQSVKSACKALEGAVEDAVRKQVKLDAKADTNLKEAKVKTGIAVGIRVVLAAGDIARLGVTMGADMGAVLSLAKQIGHLADIAGDELKKAPELLAELRNAYDEYLRSRILKEQAKTSMNARALRVADQVTSGWQSKASVAEQARRKYRDEVTRLRHNLEEMSKKTTKLEQLLASPDLKIKDRPKYQEKAKKAQADLDKLYGRFTIWERNVETMSERLTEAFAKNRSDTEVDDRTFRERFTETEELFEMGHYSVGFAAIAHEFAELAAG
jgi:hypothetical protein